MAKKRVLGVPAKLPHGYSVVSVRDCGWQYDKDKMAHFARRGHIAKNFAWVWEPDFCWAVNGAGDSVIVLRRSSVFSLHTLISCDLHTICPTHGSATVSTAANYYNPHVARLVQMLAPTGVQWAMLHPYHYESISPGVADGPQLDHYVTMAQTLTISVQAQQQATKAGLGGCVVCAVQDLSIKRKQQAWGTRT